jgi:hypothetical protein
MISLGSRDSIDRDDIATGADAAAAIDDDVLASL